MRLYIFLRTMVQKQTNFELLIENRSDIFLEAVGFVKNCQDTKKRLNDVTAIV